MSAVNTSSPAYRAAAPKAAKPAQPFLHTRLGKGLTGVFSIAFGILIWEMLSWRFPPLFLPSPLLTLQAVGELWSDGTLLQSIGASLARIMAGWGLGLVVGIPLGIVMGYFSIVRRLLDPYVEFFRFIPPIAFVTLAVIWLGPGEASKVALIFYTTVFIVMINTIAGVLSVSELRLRAAAALGASRLQILHTVIFPSTVPYMVTGARIAMGNSFLTIVSAEIVAAQIGLGSMIWTSRNYGKTEWVFVGIIALGLLGYTCDRVVRFIVQRVLKRYAVAV
ncbi:MAG TPA: ABC transporter permease [Xanthobacteraceae bacterium]|jgi:ABC-type nitrate/sulfonate/bicarbonate transport system permease component|nr:ABC transporter permease [Xanthobacteraceae bacterium]